MSELREAAERLANIPLGSTSNMDRQDRINGTRQMLDDLQRLAREDGCLAAAWAVEIVTHFADPTPLSELTDEQWRAEGFDNIHGNWCLRMDRDDTDIILMINPDVTIDLLDEIGCRWEFPLYLHVKTLGQLRALMFAIGGES